MKYILYIDTTSKTCMYALFDEDFYLKKTSYTPTNNNLVDMCVDILDDFLKKLSLNYGDLEKIYLNLGPGSFTGVRVGINLAKTIWSVYQNIEVYGTNALEILSCGNGVGIIDAKGNKSYLAQYQNGQEIIPIKIINNDELQNNSELNMYPSFDATKIGDVAGFEKSFAYLKYFKKIDDILNLEPLYIKSAL